MGGRRWRRQSFPNGPTGASRQIARDAVKREAAQRDLAAKQRQIEILKTFANRQFGRLNRTLVWAIVWIFILGAAFFAADWYATDLFNALLAALGTRTA